MNQEPTEPIKKRRVFRLGDTVQIMSGPFANFTGRVDGINQAKALLKIEVDIFGRTTPIKLNFSQVKHFPTRVVA